MTRTITADTYRGLVRHREFRALWTGNALGTAATSMSSLSLGMLVHAETSSPLLRALVMFGPSLVQVVGAGTLMSLADTTSPRALLSTASAIMASAFAMQAAFDITTVGRLTIVFAAAYVLSISGGVRWGLLSEVLPDGGYALGRSAMNISVGVMQIVGYAAGGLLLSVYPIGTVFWFAVLLVGSAVPITWFGIGEHPPRRRASCCRQVAASPARGAISRLPLAAPEHRCGAVGRRGVHRLRGFARPAGVARPAHAQRTMGPGARGGVRSTHHLPRSRCCLGRSHRRRHPTACVIALLALGSLLVSMLLTPALRRAAVEAPIARTLAGHPVSRSTPETT